MHCIDRDIRILSLAFKCAQRKFQVVCGGEPAPVFDRQRDREEKAAGNWMLECVDWTDWL